MINKRICSIMLAIATAFSPAYAFAAGEEAPLQEQTVTEAETTQEQEQDNEKQQPADSYVAPENELQIFVSPDGNDGNPGSYQQPLKSITAGITKAALEKEHVKGKTVSVNIFGGDYYINDTIKLNVSGTKENPFIIRGVKGETVNIKMSKKLVPNMFSQASGKDIINKLPVNSRKYVGEYNLGGILNSADNNNYNLIVNGSEQTVARWPDREFDRVAGVVNTTTFTGKGAGTRVSRWSGEGGAQIKGYFGVEYSFATVSIAGINGSEVNLATKPYYGIKANDRYYIENLPQELDSPGEYYVDVKNKKLYFYPPYNINGSDIEFVESTKTMMTGSKLSNVVIENLSFIGTQGDGLKFSNCDNIVVDGCEIRHVGGMGIYVTDSINSAVKNSTICYTGNGCIYITGGDRGTLTSGNNVVENNHLYDFARVNKTDGNGIWTDGVGTLIQHNLIHNSSASAVRFAGNDHKILYNEMYNVVNEPCDAGAIYAGRNYTYRGIEVAYNYIHDIDTTANKGGSIYVAAIYYDDLMSSANTHHNILYKCNLGAMIGGGRDHIFENNIIADCENGLFFDARGVGWASYHAAKGGQAYNTISTVPYTKSPWKDRYPELVTILDVPEDLGKPMNNTVKNNILYKCMSNMIANEFKEYGVYENNFESKTDGSYFEDLENRKLGLKKDSKMAKDYPGIAQIDMSQIGLLKEKADSEKSKSEKAGFRLIYPFNGQDGISNLTSRFEWDKHNGSDKYIVKIAEDPEMKNVVVEQESNKNYADVKYIPSGKKAFWWTVTGVNTSQSMPGEFEQFGAPRLLFSVLTEKTDKKELLSNMDLCQKLYNGITEGKAAGTFKKGYKDTVKAALDRANAANTAENVKQKEIEEANEEIKNVIGSISKYLNYDTMNIGDMIKDQTGWTTKEGKFTFGSDGTLTLSGSSGRSLHYELCGYNAALPASTSIKFGYKVNVSSNYCIIGLQNDPTAFLNTGYDIIIKSNQFEIQKRVEGTTGDPIKTTDLNFYISDNKWVDLEFGALQLDIGTYVFLKADGYLVTEFLDTEAPKWTGDSKFTFSNPSGTAPDCYASIRAAKDN